MVPRSPYRPANGVTATAAEQTLAPGARGPPTRAWRVIYACAGADAGPWSDVNGSDVNGGDLNGGAWNGGAVNGGDLGCSRGVGGGSTRTGHGGKRFCREEVKPRLPRASGAAAMSRPMGVRGWRLPLLRANGMSAHRAHGHC